MSTVAARSVFRSAASRISSAAKPKATASSFRIPTQKPISSRILSSPVTMSSFCLESMLPYHTATASALLTSMLSAAPRHYGWTLEGAFFYSNTFLVTFCILFLLRLGLWITSV